MILRRLNLLPTSGSPLAWAWITGFATSTPSVQAWRNHDHDNYICFTHSLVAIQLPPSSAMAKCRFGRRSRSMKTLRRHLCICPVIPSNCWISTTMTFRNSTDWLTVIRYDEASLLSSVNERRRELFCHKSRAVDKHPPTNDALLQHSRRVFYQAGIWTTSVWIRLTEFCLDKSITVMGTSLDDNLWNFSIVQWAAPFKDDCSNYSCGKANLYW